MSNVPSFETDTPGVRASYPGPHSLPSASKQTLDDLKKDYLTLVSDELWTLRVYGDIYVDVTRGGLWRPHSQRSWVNAIRSDRGRIPPARGYPSSPRRGGNAEAPVHRRARQVARRRSG